MEIWRKKTFCLITGASRGIGNAIALKFSEKLAPGSVMCLIARNEEKLQEAKKEIQKSNRGISVSVHPADLGKTEFDQFKEILAKCCPNPGIFEEAMIVHNAGSGGTVDKKMTEHEDTQFLVTYYRENLISTITLNSAFFKHFKETKALKVVITISSAYAIRPGTFVGNYCSVKASRDMLFRVIAAEEPDSIVLLYSPGPVETAMFNEVRNSGVKEVRDRIGALDSAGKVLTCDMTVTRLIGILEEGKFKSGDRVDYFDK